MRAWMTPRDEGWLVQMADGDRTALAEVLAAYGSVVLSLVEHIIGPSSEAEEVVQEVFLLLWRQAPSWPSRSALPLGAWLLHKARTMALTELHRAPELGACGRDVALLPRRRRVEPLLCDSNNAEALHAARRRSRRALASLRPTARRLLSLTLLRNLTPAALGELTGQPSPKARRLLLCAVRCAREALRAQSDSYR